MHGHHSKLFGLIFLIIGIIFLLVDLGTWTFWGIQWYTVLFLVFGIMHLFSHYNPDAKVIKKK